jgi:Arm DNA-binding domain
MRKYPSAKDLAKITKPGRYAAGHGLYLQVGPNGRSWVFRYRSGEKSTLMGMGSCDYVTLQEARDKSIDAQRQRLNGLDPLTEKRRAKVQRARPASVTFADAARQYIIAHEDSWRGDESRRQWQSSLNNYAFPTLGAMSVAEIETRHILASLEPIWRTIPETARRVRNRIELVLDFATAHEMRRGDNPARRPAAGEWQEAPCSGPP